MEQGSGTGTPVLERVDLAATTGAPAVSWAIAAAGCLVVFLAAFVLTESLFGLGTLATLPALWCLYLVSWWRAARMAAAIGELERQSAAGVFRVRVRSATSMWFGWGVNTELVVADGWVLLGNGGWPAASVALGREPNWWSGRSIELQTPSGTVGVSVVPKGDVGMYMATIVDREVRPLLARAIEAQCAAGPSPAR